MIKIGHNLVTNGDKCSGGSRGQPPPAQNAFIFIQFSGKLARSPLIIKLKEDTWNWLNYLSDCVLGKMEIISLHPKERPPKFLFKEPSPSRRAGLLQPKLREVGKSMPAMF